MRAGGWLDGCGRISTHVWSGGGCAPTRRSILRRFATPARLRARRSTVARPTGVSPSTVTKSASHAKWSAHESRRGLNKGAAAPVTGSCPSTAVNLRLLHPWHDHARLSRSLEPPREPGTTCSTENGSGE
ncbi:MAG: hypothetical protein AVDCRST_MAG64-3307 [uncultured Phycisphaerae bacterium]|uniref:Uncharacterized protein n=1 Tax=uncultured Phycisphaerae bacterium TaxID=904963 RepID=A0A6J4Q1L3_9BACT|nr:MAG: hypothetical protein AVDCRST_MAG64-3307 [uncultured Phycisphaerae bacterium]